MDQDLWALKDVSFEVKAGEVVGIIGRNGAGKSTLLKILSRVTAPTIGQIKVHGRVASLLEVGTGFHPELTGRENTYLNGSILGMTKKEIDYKFDEIIAFAELDRFIDTPVKRYSSGMYVRLAFAVAAHLDPEILVVDEVLAVGDAAFQKKCLGKMGEVAKEGRTVLFVSHNMSAVRQLCPYVILLKSGELALQGDAAEIIDSYLDDQAGGELSRIREFDVDDSKHFQLLSVYLLGPTDEPGSYFECDMEIRIILECISRVTIPGLYGYMTISRSDGSVVVESDSFDSPPNIFDNLTIGQHRLEIRIPSRLLAPGKYYIYFNFTSSQAMMGFHVDSPGIVNSFTLSDNASPRGNSRDGAVSTLLPWKPLSL